MGLRLDDQLAQRSLVDVPDVRELRDLLPRALAMEVENLDGEVVLQQRHLGLVYEAALQAVVRLLLLDLAQI